MLQNWLFYIIRYFLVEDVIMVVISKGKKKRVCLVCNRMFMSSGPFNRRCSRCCRHVVVDYHPLVHKVHKW